MYNHHSLVTLFYSFIFHRRLGKGHDKWFEIKTKMLVSSLSPWKIILSCLPLHLGTKARYWYRTGIKSTCRQAEERGGGTNESKGSKSSAWDADVNSQDCPARFIFTTALNHPHLPHDIHTHAHTPEDTVLIWTWPEIKFSAEPISGDAKSSF